MLRLVIPKGSLEEQTLRLFAAADLTVRRSSPRDYHGRVEDERIERVSLLRPQEIPSYIADGLFDLGITGRDWIEETGAAVDVLGSLQYAKSGAGRAVRIVLAVPNGHPATSATELPPGSRISTEYVNLTRRYFEAIGVEVHVVWSYGATEAKVPEIVDAIVDVVESGSTLRAHGLRVVETLLESEVLLVANRDAAREETKRRAMDDVATLLLGALRAEGRVLIKLNVSEDRLQEVLACVPAMRSPTVSRLSVGGYAVETVVEKATVNRLIPLLKQHGAADILEVPISKIVP